MSEIPSFISVCGMPSDTDVVEVEARAEAILIRQGWTPPLTTADILEWNNDPL